MKKIIEGLVIGAGVMVIVGIVAVLGGTVVWLIWPYAFPVIFPKAVAAGVLAAKIPWWSAVCLTWICGILIKSTNSNKNEK